MVEAIRAKFPLAHTLEEHLALVSTSDLKTQNTALDHFLQSTIVCDEIDECQAYNNEQCKNASALASVSEVVEWVIQTLVFSPRSKTHVLSAGFRARRINDTGMGNSSGVEIFYPNSVPNLLNTLQWESLRSLIGSSALCAILLNCSVFVQLKSGCFIQLAGQPLHEIGGPRRAKLTRHLNFDRWRIFYCNSYQAKAGLPPRHVLASLTNTTKNNSSTAAAHTLLRYVFRPSPHRGLGRRLRQAVPVFAQVLERCRRFRFGRTLERCCPIPLRRTTLASEQQPSPKSKAMAWHSFESGYASQPDSGGMSDDDDEDDDNRDAEEEEDQDGDVGGADDYGDEVSGLRRSTLTQPPLPPSRHGKGRFESIPLKALLLMESSHAQVNDFVRRVCKGLFPPSLWGSKHNEAIFFRKMAAFVCLRRHEGMCAAEFTQDMRVTDMAWLQLEDQQPAEEAQGRRRKR